MKIVSTKLGTVITIAAALVFSVSLVYLVNDWYLSEFDIEKWRADFYSQEFDPSKKKIFLLGSSMVVRINQTFIEDYLLQNEKYFDVYNLGEPLDLPIRRIKSVDDIISAKPDVVIYGIGLRDLRPGGNFEEVPRYYFIPINELEKPKFFLFNMTDKVIEKNLNLLGFDKIKNPKFVSLKLLNVIDEGKIRKPQQKKIPNTHFSTYVLFHY